MEHYIIDEICVYCGYRNGLDFDTETCEESLVHRAYYIDETKALLLVKSKIKRKDKCLILKILVMVLILLVFCGAVIVAISL